MKNHFHILGVLIFLMAGCAGVEITKVAPTDANKAGIRFYRPWPYLLVTKDANGVLQSSIIYLPRTNEGYAINVKSGMGKVDSSFTLADGWRLTQFGDIRDSKIPETIDAIPKMIGAITGVATALEKEEKLGVAKPVPSLELYRFDCNDRNGFVESIVQVPVKL